MALTQEQKQEVKQFMTSTMLQDTPSDTSMPTKEQAIEEVRRLRQPQKSKGDFLGKATDFILPGVRGFGGSIAGSIIPETKEAKELTQSREQLVSTQDTVLDRIREKRSRGEDVSRLLGALKESGINIEAEDSAINPAIGKSNKQVVGEAIGTAASVIGLGTIGKAAKGAQSFQRFKGVPSILGGGATQATGRATLEGLKTGAKFGAGFGAIEGGAAALRRDEGVGDVIQGVATGGAIGGLAGGALGAAAGGIGGATSARKLRKLESQKIFSGEPTTLAPSNGLGERAVIKTQSDDLLPGTIIRTQDETEQLAKFKVEGGTIKQDTESRKLLRGVPGLEEADVVQLKSLTQSEKKAALEMLDTTQKSKANRGFVKRSSDIVGDEIVNKVKIIQKEIKKAGKNVDEAAKGLKGVKVDYTAAESNFIDMIQEQGVFVDDAGDLIFEGSSFEGVTPAQNLLKTVWKRLRGIDDDAIQGHRLKKLIDENVEWGKSAEGLKGTSVRIVKELRRDIDGVLDGAVPAYDLANTQYSQLINIADNIGDVLGTKFDINSGFANIRAGQVARRALGNSANRGDVLRMFQILDRETAKLGGDANRSITNLVIVNDILEDIFGTQATTGLQGQVGRALEQSSRGVRVAQNLAQGNLLGAGKDVIELAADRVLGTTDQEIISALEIILKR